MPAGVAVAVDVSGARPAVDVKKAGEMTSVKVDKAANVQGKPDLHSMRLMYCEGLAVSDKPLAELSPIHCITVTDRQPAGDDSFIIPDDCRKHTAVFQVARQSHYQGD